MANQTLHSLVDSVKSSVLSPSTCTSDTVSLLRKLLSAVDDERKTGERKSAKTVKAGSSSRRQPRTGNSRATTKVAVFQTRTESPIPPLSKQNKIALATEIFNASSRTLSEHIKLQSPRPFDNALKKNTVTKNPGSPKKPLQPTSPNRTIRSPTKAKGISERLNERNTAASNVTGVAESALLALSSLRDLKCNEDGTRILNVQLEQGLCILIGKLFAVGLNNMAIRELRLLKGRIRAYFDSETPKVKLRRTANPAKEIQSERASEKMEDLVLVPKVPEDGAMIQLFVSLQNLALRAVITEGQPATAQKMMNHLVFSNPCSPPNLILAAYKFGTLSADKAAQQLQSLSSSILSLAALTVSPGEGVPCSMKSRIKPTVTVALQILSLEVKCLWWKMAGHRYDADKELWHPLARYFSALTRHCSAIKKADFECIKEAFLRLKTSLNSNGYNVNIRNVKSASVSIVLRILGQLAYTAGCLSDAIEFCKASTACLTASQPLQLAICCCKTAFVQIEFLKTSPRHRREISSAISDAANNLSAPLKGNLTDLDELLMEAAKLKKTIMKAVNGLTDAAVVDNTMTFDVESLWLSINEYLMSFVRFLSRYLGPSPPFDAEANSKAGFMLRLGTCKNIAISAVDSSIAVAKISLSTEQPPWGRISPLLIDCFGLLNRLSYDHCNNDNNQASNGVSSGLLRLSNLYWSRYAAQKEAGKSAFELVPLLERSINILGHCAPAEQTSGFIAIKIERLATIYSEIGHEAKAETNYCSAIRAHIIAGTLELASAQSFQRPFRYIWKNPQSPAYALGRVLGSYIKARLKQVRKTSQLAYDDEALDVESRALLLESQMAFLVDSFAVDPSDMLAQCLASMITKLLAIYSIDIFPLRRSRVLVSSLRLFLESNIDFDSDFCDYLSQEAKSCLSQGLELYKDQDLYPYQEDIMSSLRLALGFYSGDLQTADLQLVIQSWAKMSQSWATWESVEAKISDPHTWISQLRGLVDYLEIKAQWMQQITLLSVLEKVLELQEKLKSSVLSPSTCTSDTVSLLRKLLSAVDDERKTGERKSAKTVKAGSSSRRQPRTGNSRATTKVAVFQTRTESPIPPLSKQNKIALATEIFNASSRTLSEHIKLQSPRPFDNALKKNTVTKNPGSPKKPLQPTSPNRTIRSPTKAKGISERLNERNTAASNVTGVAESALLALSSLRDLKSLDASEALGATCLATLIKAELGSYNIRGNQVDKGQELLKALEAELPTVHETIHTVALRYHVSALHEFSGKLEEEYEMLDACHNALAELLRTGITELPCRPNSEIDEIQTKIKELSLDTRNESRPQRKTRHAQRSGKTSKQSEKASVTKTYGEPGLPRASSLLQLRGDILRRQAEALLSNGRLQDAGILLDEAEKLTSSKNSHVSQCIRRANLYLNEAVHKLASHGVYCVLPESCIALSSVQQTESAQDLASSATSSASSPKKKSKPSRLVGEDFTGILSTARQDLYTFSPLAVTHCSTMDCHVFSYLTSKVSALSYATSKGGDFIDPFSTLQLKVFVKRKRISSDLGTETGRDTALLREHCAIMADKQLSESAKLPKWPLVPDIRTNGNSLQFSDVSKDCIDLLPDTWNVVSISLGVDHNEFVISKLRAGQAPFMLCLPLKRSDSDDDDEETFSFDDGKAELLEIIKLANRSAHDTRARVDKKAKKEWWANREALDTRLKDLLHNIENIWFGGFRGIFSQKPKNEALLSRFIHSFEKTLNKHLPSRRGKRGKNKDCRLSLDRNVMELFVNIRRLSDEDDPEDSVMDLLYFVVDALQFQGERNAYDEIDFDMMVIETLDALRSYAEAEQREENSQPQPHTILILDKTLHSFPWESLDCLQGCSVSRIPSLHCLRERLFDIKAQQGANVSRQGYHIKKESGAFILNPSGDLKSTQNTFQFPLSKFDGWTNITQKEPSEEDFRGALESKDLLLYFGHGSGAQYIRGRTIKRLDRCAVTFLMGCSSGAMIEAGEFEPYGTPWNYMQAGSPALVATLWDVTDKDIDRFAEGVFKQWGLFSSEEENPGLGRLSRKNGKMADNSESGLGLEEPGSVGLDTAVARSRDACILKYLNGAAPVVYGVPVFLE
ncbi:separin [Coccidioides immitis RMSCC 2394]|uniref:separase n=1 Tax=Coccidioides immitis RMSCC 2394 TaxID=404692 RepID=A0A0J6YAU5_COCIT|nr:separin [Coccidioides immitis RMSCC 2394]